MSDYKQKCIFLLKILGILISLFNLLFILLLIISLVVPEEKYHYEYIDLDNYEGIAKECSYKFDESFRGGQGSPVCELEDGTIKQVKQYKYILDYKKVPLKEIFRKESE